MAKFDIFQEELDGIQQQIENPLAQKILAGDIAPREVVEVDAVDGRFVFSGVLTGEIVDA